jgi:hypothetical protein
MQDLAFNNTKKGPDEKGRVLQATNEVPETSGKEKNSGPTLNIASPEGRAKEASHTASAGKQRYGSAEFLERLRTALERQFRFNFRIQVR